MLILATRTRLIRQLHERLDAFGISHGVIAAPLPQWLDLLQPVQIAAVDTLYRRALVDQRAPLPAADVVIFDEAHLALGNSRVKLLEQFPQALRLGFTATPCKTSGRPLSAMFDALVPGPSIRELIALGALVKPRIFTAPAISVRELREVAVASATGDYAIGQRPR